MNPFRFHRVFLATPHEDAAPLMSSHPREVKSGAQRQGLEGMGSGRAFMLRLCCSHPFRTWWRSPCGHCAPASWPYLSCLIGDSLSLLDDVHDGVTAASPAVV